MKEYTMATLTGETTVQLSAEDAERYGDRVKPVVKTRKVSAESKAVTTPQNKAAAAPSDKQAAAAAEAFGAK